jgi:putative ABC transport system permease protein
VLKPMLRVVTPRLSLSGIASYVTAKSDAAKTFVGVGLVPSDRERMRQWDEFGVAPPYHPDGKLIDGAPDRGVVGVGVARVLGVCGHADLPPCAEHPQPATAAGPDMPADIKALVSEDAPTQSQAPDELPRIDLLAATAAGAPNVVALSVSGAEPQGAKEFDDVYVGMHLALAQDLVYGRGTHKATAIVLQLNRTEEMPAARARLHALFREQNLPLEVRDFVELTPFYGQTHSFFGALFLFIAIIMGVIVLFTVINTMTMAVVERTNEIGATRALGLRRGAVRRQFVVEGWVLGVLGATLGLLLAWGVVAAVNGANLTWTPPGNSSPVPFRLAMSGTGGLALGIWAALVLVATLAALIPANRAARLKVVDALRHV